MKEDEPDFCYHLALLCKHDNNYSYVSEQNVNHLLSIIPLINNRKDQPHGLGRYKTREMAEAARAYLIQTLDRLKRVDLDPVKMGWLSVNDFIVASAYVDDGKEIIKRMKDGTYD